MELKKYEIGNKVSSSAEYLFNRGWSICDDGFIYIADLRDRYGWSYKIKYTALLKSAFKNARGTQFVLDPQFEDPRGEERISAQAVDKEGNKYLVYWDVADDWKDDDEDMTHAADWTNPVSITEA